MSYAILRFSKMKGGSSKAIEAHHERTKEKYASNPDIETDKNKLNYHLIQPDLSYNKEIQRRIEQAGCRVRKDSVKYIDTLITASPEFFEGKSQKEIRAFFVRATNFMAQKIGRDNIFSATVHLDERTPHMHLCFVPLTQDNRLCASEILGNRKKLCGWQDEFHSFMAEKYPRLERGEGAILTGRKHLPVQLYKQATRLDAQWRQIKAALDSTTRLNVPAKKEELNYLLEKWLPDAVNYQKQMQGLEEQNKQLGRQLRALKKDSSEKNSENFHQRMELAALQSELLQLRKTDKRNRALLESIPKDILAELAENNPQINQILRKKAKGYDALDR